MHSPPEQETVERCPTCGATVEVVTADEGTSHYRPVEHELLQTAEAERDRLRKRTHEIQEDESRKRAGLQSQVDSHRASMERAREAVAEFRADWTSDPPSQQRGGLWRYTSKNTRDALVCLIEDLEAAEARARKAEEALAELAQDAFLRIRDATNAALATIRDGV